MYIPSADKTSLGLIIISTAGFILSLIAIILQGQLLIKKNSEEYMSNLTYVALLEDHVAPRFLYTTEGRQGGVPAGPTGQEGTPAGPTNLIAKGLFDEYVINFHHYHEYLILVSMEVLLKDTNGQGKAQSIGMEPMAQI